MQEWSIFLSLFHQELQKLLKPIYDFTRKDRQFIWDEEQQQAFDEIKRRLVKLPVLHLQTIQLDFIYTQILEYSLQEVLYTKFKMAN